MGSEFRAVGMISVNRSIFYSDSWHIQRIGEVERESEKIIEKSLPIQKFGSKDPKNYGKIKEIESELGQRGIDALIRWQSCF